ncbi:MAG: glycogen debranching enzyme family protein [Deltaproteobacteria bacterium]|nr:glycogen debranching enzyme family protein [Deltaproteobacteria bacterium]
MESIIRKIRREDIKSWEAEPFNSLEWLVTNGIGGYASGTVSGVITRRYHGLLIASMPVPLGRISMLSHLAELIELPDGRTIEIFGEEFLTKQDLYQCPYLKEFRLESGLPVWHYEFEGFVLEKRIIMPYQQNTVHMGYTLIKGEGLIKLKLRPSINFRHHEAPVNVPLVRPYTIQVTESLYEFSSKQNLPPLRMLSYGHNSSFTIEERTIVEILYTVEECRGYDCLGDLWSPGHFSVDLREGGKAALVSSTESWETILALKSDDAMNAELLRRERLLSEADPRSKKGLGPELILAADQFIITPVGRIEDSARARAAGDEMRTVIAGYHWFTDWGRDTMISLEGLALLTGRHLEAGYILRTFDHYIRDGLIPNMFPEGTSEGLYHTADATLWFFHAMERYLEFTRDMITLRRILPSLIKIIDHHIKGTRFGIGMDKKDCLMKQGQKGYQLTWMDAKVGEWVVTPRRGKAVEINALWYNALCLLADWVRLEKGDKAANFYIDLSKRVKKAFNEKFWNEKRGCLYDVVDGELGEKDNALRPNQLFSISLKNPVLERDKWEPVVSIVQERLVTDFGLRSLSSDHPNYKKRYFGDLRSRDAAYHQGTVWAWLIGPFIDAWLKTYPEKTSEARELLNGFWGQLSAAGVGTMSEVFDAEEPFSPGGCIAQAWSVAELLRCLVKTS